MSEPNSLDLMYEALTGPSRSIYKENPGLVLAAVVTSPDAGSGSMALTREEHVELEQATGRVLAVA